MTRRLYVELQFDTEEEYVTLDSLTDAFRDVIADIPSSTRVFVEVMEEDLD